MYVYMKPQSACIICSYPKNKTVPTTLPPLQSHLCSGGGLGRRIGNPEENKAGTLQEEEEENTGSYISEKMESQQLEKGYNLH